MSTHTTHTTNGHGPVPKDFLGYPKVESPAQVRHKPFNENLRNRLEQYQKDHKLSQGELGKKLGVSSTAISKYLNGKPEGDVAKLESIAEDVLKTALTFRRIDKQPRETSVSRSIAANINTARKTNDIALITGPAGIGKSKGLELYHLENPSAVAITAARWCRNATEMFRALWDAVETAGWSRGHASGHAVRKIDFLIERLKGSDRPLIIDNAHRLRPGALEFLFDFHDATEIPIILIGNPEIKTLLAKNDQQFSRIGLHKHIEGFDRPREVAEMVIGQVAPDFSLVVDLAVKVLTQQGKARALRKQLSLAQELASKESFRDELAKKGITANEELFEAAFKAAHTRLIRNYKLD
jgi:DNA transposition AAA+ family ATPase